MAAPRRDDGRREPVSFFPDESFSRIERAFFLRILSRNPIDKGRVTSLYGWRSDPFTGSREFHGGLDISAPDGTAVHAARDGRVEEVGTSDELGRYVVLTHPGGYQTVYGHLSAIECYYWRTGEHGLHPGRGGSHGARHGIAPSLRGADQGRHQGSAPADQDEIALKFTDEG